LRKPHLALVAPSTVIGTVEPNRPPRRRPNKELRVREHLTKAEVDRLIEAARDNRNALRDQTMILVAFRHGLRCVELVNLQWDAVDFTSGHLHVRRVKNGSPSTHPISGRELRALRRLQRDQEPASPFVFTSELGTPFTQAGFAKMLARVGEAADFKYRVHPHQLRHACGFVLANLGTDTRALQAYLGHKNIQHTVRYTALSPTRFKNIWQDNE
jgi:type 1 fimbriae regulatory protein FimB/type 1 fimbriae regulatory protein FimE